MDIEIVDVPWCSHKTKKQQVIFYGHYVSLRSLPEGIPKMPKMVMTGILVDARPQVRPPAAGNLQAQPGAIASYIHNFR